MRRYQQALPTAKPGEKWLLMDKIFSLDKFNPNAWLRYSEFLSDLGDEPQSKFAM